MGPVVTERTVAETPVAVAAAPAPAISETQVATATPTDPSTSAREAAGLVWASGSATVKAAGQALAQIAGLGDATPSSATFAEAQVVEPLTRVTTPRDSRRSRLLAYSVAYDPHAANSVDAARSRDHVTRRMTDDSVYDSISRLGVSGNSVSIKF